MRRRYSRAVVLVCALLLPSCARTVVLGTATCPGPAPADAGPYHRYDADSAARVAGAYELVAINLSRGERLPPMRARLVLGRVPATDSAAVLSGTATWLTAGGRADTLNTGKPFTEAAEVDASGVLLIGCIRCLDGGATRYRIVATSLAGLWGLWEMPINENLMDLEDEATGRKLPNPAGVFCAQRLSPAQP